MTVFSMQLRATLLILFVVLVRSLFLYKLPKKTFLGLWALVFVRLVIPYSWNLSLGFSLPSIETLWLSLLPIASGAPGVESIHSVYANMTLINYSVPVFLYWIWLAGSVAMAAYFAAGHLRSKRIFQFACPVESEAVRLWIDESRIRRKVRVLQCQELSSALTYGIFRPIILLPKAMAYQDTERIRFVLSHELEHIRHYDVLWKWMSALVLCLNWYNPMVWAMYALFSRDLELHCDECVLKRHGVTQKSKSAYALALLALAEEKTNAFPLTSHFSRSAAEERILSVMHSRYAPAIVVGAALLGIAIIALLSFVTFMMESAVAFTLPIQ